MNKMKSAAQQAKVKDHPLFTGEYSTEVRNAYFSVCAASLCFLDENLDANEENNLQLFGQSLRLSSTDVADSIKTVKEISDDDKMDFLQEVFSLMDSDYLKYALLTDINTLFLKKGSLTDDEKDFINMSSEILFCEEKDIFKLWEKGLTIDNINTFFDKVEEVENQETTLSTQEENIVPSRDVFFVNLADKNREIWLDIAEKIKNDDEYLTLVQEQGFDENLRQKLFEDYDSFYLAYYQKHSNNGAPLESPIDMSQIPDDVLQEMVCNDISIEDMRKGKTLADLNEILVYKMGTCINSILLDFAQKRLESKMNKIDEQIAEYRQAARLACFAGINDNHVYVAPNIPYDKLTNAIEAYASYLDPDDVLVLFDDTAFGGARDGMLITQDCVYSHDIFSDPVNRFFFKDSEIKYGGKKIYIDGEQACNLCLASESVIKELAEGIAALREFTE